MNGLKETSPGVWHTPSTVYAEAAWLDMIAAGEYGPKAQHKMIETLAEHFNAYAYEIRRECADKATAWLAELHGEVPDPTLPWSSKLMRVRALQVSTLTAAIMSKEARE